MDLVQIYQCLSDQTRIRILHLLTQTPLCVCHLQEILDKPQVKVSKHLAYLRTRGMVDTSRDQNWIVYSLPRKQTRELEKNLRCLEECGRADSVFKSDLKKLEKLRATCCDGPRGALTAAKR